MISPARPVSIVQMMLTQSLVSAATQLAQHLDLAGNAILRRELKSFLLYILDRIDVPIATQLDLWRYLCGMFDVLGVGTSDWRRSRLLKRYKAVCQSHCTNARARYCAALLAN